MDCKERDGLVDALFAALSDWGDAEDAYERLRDELLIMRAEGNTARAKCRQRLLELIRHDRVHGCDGGEIQPLVLGGAASSHT